MPQACAVNITAHTWKMDVPSILIVAPKGIEKDETSLPTPSSYNFSKLIGIVALEEHELNANSITGKNLL